MIDKQLRFANRLVLIKVNYEGIQTIISGLYSALDNKCLKMNLSNTKVMTNWPWVGNIQKIVLRPEKP